MKIESEKLEARIKELEEALRFYAEENNIHIWDRVDDGNFYFSLYEDKEFETQFGTTARKALEKGEV